MSYRDTISHFNSEESDTDSIDLTFNSLNSQNLTIMSIPIVTENNTQNETPVIFPIPNLKSEYIKMIPEFSGETELLPRFLEICQKLVNRFYNANDPDDFQNEYLMSSIRSKIKGEAALNLSNCIINDWNDLKDSLINAYCDKRDTYTLCIEMTNLKQNINETPFDFFNRLQKTLNLQLSYIKTHSKKADEIFVLCSYFQNYALRILLRGLKEPVGSMMRTKNPSDLGSALNMLTNDFQLDSLGKTRIDTNIQNPNNKNNFSQKNTYKMINPRYNTPIKANAQNQQNKNFNFQSNANRNPQHPSPLNRPPITRLFTPRQNNPNNYTPTPMSISTRNTFNSTNRNFTPRPSTSNQINFSPNQNFISEELFNIEQENEPFLEDEASENLN